MEGDGSNGVSNGLLHLLHQEIEPTGGLSEEDGWEWPAQGVLEASSSHKGDSQEAEVSVNMVVTEEPCNRNNHVTHERFTVIKNILIQNIREKSFEYLKYSMHFLKQKDLSCNREVMRMSFLI